MRLIDLRCDWSLQYAAESSQYDPNEYAEIPRRVARLDGYLMGTSLAVLVCRRKPADWARHADRWHALGEMIARYEAEFSGRLLRGPEDLARWRAEPADALCWGVLAVGGLENLVREPADLDRIPALFERGVRIFNTIPGDLGRGLLERLLSLAAAEGPRPAVDLRGMDAAAIAAALDWFEADSARRARLPLFYTGEMDGLDPAVPRRLRSLGATIGVRPRGAAEDFRASVESLVIHPFLGRTGYEGIGIATDYLDLEMVATELSDVDRLTAWASTNFSEGLVQSLMVKNALGFLLGIVGAKGESSA